jgi:hypothetical protein
MKTERIGLALGARPASDATGASRTRIDIAVGDVYTTFTGTFTRASHEGRYVDPTSCAASACITRKLDTGGHFVRRTAQLVIVLAALAALAAPSALAADRMWIGFHDDPSFRWSPDRAERIESSARNGATMIRLLVHWNQTAPRRPDRPSDPFDPAYNFSDLDEAVRTAQEADLEVLLTIYGTPKWANNGRGANRMPRRVADFRHFAQAIAARYSGRFEYPFVRFWSVWNEPNLQVFLAPQFDRRGKPLAPRNYAQLYAAAYRGIKAGNPRAKVGIGETSARGSDKPGGKRPIHSPGKFAELVAKANPRLKFDAWAHHPYPFVPTLKPSQKVRWPNVTLASLPEFQKHLKRWFKRSKVSIWVTEYGHQTKPQDRFGVSYAKQARYIRESIALARKQRFVGMFVWFVYQDDPGQPWESGLYTQSGRAKGNSPRAFARAARTLNARNSVISLRRGTRNPAVTVYTRGQCGGDAAKSIGVTWRILLGGRQIGAGPQSSTMAPDCTIKLNLSGFRAARSASYVAQVRLEGPEGIQLLRSLTLRAS